MKSCSSTALRRGIPDGASNIAADMKGQPGVSLPGGVRAQANYDHLSTGKVDVGININGRVQLLTMFRVSRCGAPRILRPALCQKNLR